MGKKRHKKSKPNHKKLNKTVTKNGSGFFRRCLSKKCLATATILSLVLAIAALGLAYVQYKQAVESAEENRVLTEKNKALIEYNRGLLENLVTNKYEKDLQSKYPGGYTLFGFDHLREFEHRSTPHASDVLEEYEFDWRRVRISEENETNITIEFPNIHYKPLNTNLIGTAMIIPKSPKGESYRYPVRPKGTKNRVFCELVEYNDSFYLFAIGFKPADN